MTLDDAGLSRVALGLLSAAGAILAVSATVWIFVFDRRTQTEVDALNRVRTSGEALYDFLSPDTGVAGNYIRGLASYVDFARLIAAVSYPFSTDSVPDYITWRARTMEIIETSTNVNKMVDAAGQQILEGGQPTNLDRDIFRFHLRFQGLMFDLDLAIQHLDWAKGVRKAGVFWVGLALGLTLVVFLGSLILVLAAEIETATGFSDDWNSYWATLLTVSTCIMCGSLVWAFHVNEMSREKWIENRYKKVQREFKKNKSVNA